MSDDQLVKTMLFADVVGYSRIPESQIRNFAPSFLGAVSRLIAGNPGLRPALSNTWGDALYMVFDAVDQAGCFALALRRMIKETDWAAHDLPPGLGIRIGLHTGPVLNCLDPVVDRRVYTGSHVSHAARIEPVVRAGEIYVTESFVAYAEILRQTLPELGFGYDYLGELDFAKSYGRYPLFRLRET